MHTLYIYIYNTQNIHYCTDLGSNIRGHFIYIYIIAYMHTLYIYIYTIYNIYTIAQTLVAR